MARCLIAALLLAAVLPGASAQQAVRVPSLDAPQGTALQLPALWFPVDAAARAPALVLLHGCGGMFDRQGRLSARLRGYAERLNALGVAVLIPDSLTPRGETELCTQANAGRQLKQPQRRRDALGALQWLAAQPGVDRGRLGMLGWSNGGSTVLASSNRRQAEVAAAPVPASLAIAFYPGCEAELERGFEASAPLLLLVGAADDWTPAAACQALAAKAGGAPVQIEVYAGAHHGFDGTAPVRHRRDVPNGANPGQGVHVGGNAAARDASLARLDRFLTEHWALGPR